MRLIDADMVLKDIKDLQKSPWHNRWSKSDILCLQNQYVGRKEAVEIVRDLCVVKAKEVQAIPLDEVKQAREYIGQLKHKNTDVEGYRWWNNAIENCLHEIDRLIESEG